MGNTIRLRLFACLTRACRIQSNDLCQCGLVDAISVQMACREVYANVDACVFGGPFACNPFSCILSMCVVVYLDNSCSCVYGDVCVYGCKFSKTKRLVFCPRGSRKKGISTGNNCCTVAEYATAGRPSLPASYRNLLVINFVNWENFNNVTNLLEFNVIVIPFLFENSMEISFVLCKRFELFGTQM